MKKFITLTASEKALLIFKVYAMTLGLFTTASLMVALVRVVLHFSN